MKEDIYINDYNYSKDVRDWEEKHGKGMFAKDKDYVRMLKCPLLGTKKEGKAND